MTLPAVIMPQANDAAEKQFYITLAVEIAREIKDVADILQARGISDADYENIKTNPFFMKVLEAERAAWHSSMNTAERVKMEAAMLAEALLPEIYARCFDRREDLTKVTEGAKWIAKLAGLGERPVGGGAVENKPSDKFVIQINMGGKEVITHVKDFALTAPVIEGTAHHEVEQPTQEAPVIFSEPVPPVGSFFAGD